MVVFAAKPVHAQDLARNGGEIASLEKADSLSELRLLYI